MPEVSVKNTKNKVVETLELDGAVFEYGGSETLVWEAVNAYRAAQRKGTHSARTRSTARGGGKKMWRQKGTGRARMGTIRSPIWAGGGASHGPLPRDYSQAFPKKKRRGAVKRVLTDKLENGRLVVVDDLTLSSHRTKEVLGLLAGLGLGSKVLLVDDRANRNLFLGSRNLPHVKMATTLAVNVYDLLLFDYLLISKSALMELQNFLVKGNNRPDDAPDAPAPKKAPARKKAASKVEASPAAAGEAQDATAKDEAPPKKTTAKKTVAAKQAKQAKQAKPAKSAKKAPAKSEESAEKAQSSAKKKAADKSKAEAAPVEAKPKPKPKAKPKPKTQPKAKSKPKKAEPKKAVSKDEDQTPAKDAGADDATEATGGQEGGGEE